MKTLVALNALEFGGLTPHMKKGEIGCLLRYMQAANTLLEFGCGGSTLMAVNAGIKNILSVESDPKWIEKLKEEYSILEAVKHQQLKFFLPDLGPVGAWGGSFDVDSKAKWHSYHSAVWQQVDSSAIDLVFVDGRFRVACALQALLRVRSDCKILIHDFWNRSKYHVLLDFLTVEERVESLGAFRIAEPRNNSKLLDLLFLYLNNPA